METMAMWLGFFNSTAGLSGLGVAAAAMVVLWEWRSALAGLCLIQLGVAAATVNRHGIPAQWGAIMVGVMVLAALILALSARQTHARASLYQSGTWTQRGLVLLMAYAGMVLLEWRLPLPQIDPALADLFFWLGLCVLAILGLSENPLFTAVAILLWLIPAQAVTAVLLGIPALVALVGMIQLAAALACSYLILVEEVPAQDAPVITDVTFPAAGAVGLTIPKPEEPTAVPSLADWLREHVVARLPRRTADDVTSAPPAPPPPPERQP